MHANTNQEAQLGDSSPMSSSAQLKFIQNKIDYFLIFQELKLNFLKYGVICPYGTY